MHLLRARILENKHVVRQNWKQIEKDSGFLKLAFGKTQAGKDCCIVNSYYPRMHVLLEFIRRLLMLFEEFDERNVAANWLKAVAFGVL